MCFFFSDVSPTRDSYYDQPYLSGLLASGADLLRRKLIGVSAVERPSRIQSRNKIALSRLERKALKSIRILEKVESVGVDNLMAPTTVSPLAIHSTSAVYSGRVRRSDSPMTQLTSLKRLGERNEASGASVDDVVIRKATIKAVLSKGLSDSRSTVSDSDSDASSVASTSSAAESPAKSKTDVKGPTETSAVIADTCVRRMQRQKSRRNMNAQGLRRADLGTVDSNRRSSTITPETNDLDGMAKESSFTQGFVGTISSLIFGRKGGFT